MFKLEKGIHIRTNFIVGWTDVEHIFLDNGGMVVLNTKTLGYRSALTGNFTYFGIEAGRGSYIKHNDYLYMIREEPNFYS